MPSNIVLLSKSRNFLDYCKNHCPKDVIYRNSCKGICSKGLGFYDSELSNISSRVDAPRYMTILTSMMDIGKNSSDVDFVDKHINRNSLEKIIGALTSNEILIELKEPTRRVVAVPSRRFACRIRNSDYLRCLF